MQVRLLGPVDVVVGGDVAHRVWRQALAIFEDIDHPDRERIRSRLASARRQVPAGNPAACASPGGG